MNPAPYDVPERDPNPPVRGSFYATVQCDRCGREDYTVPGQTMPITWRSHEYTGETICDHCDDDETA